MSNLDIKGELHSIAAAFNWLIAFLTSIASIVRLVRASQGCPGNMVCVWLQENVSDDMVGLSSQLLANVRAMQGAVQTREGLLSEAETAQDASLVNADYAVKTSKNIKNRCVCVYVELSLVQHDCYQTGMCTRKSTCHNNNLSCSMSTGSTCMLHYIC